MRLGIICIAILLIISTSCFGQAAICPTQIKTTSWPGLTGFFVTPTARLIGRGNLAMGFNESKHSEHVLAKDFTDRQIRGVLTYGILDGLEVSFSVYNNMYVIDAGPNLNNQSFTTGAIKLRLMQEDRHYWYPEVSIAVRDIGNATRDVGNLNCVNNGRKVFLLASKRLFKDDKLGRFMDVNAGLTWDAATMSGLVGFELTVTHNTSLIVESMWDAPYVNFRRLGQCRSNRYVFDPGIRFYPELIPNMAFDLGFVGDGEFEFSFGVSYVAHL